MTDWQDRLISIFNAKVALDKDSTNALLNSWIHETTLQRGEFLIRKDQTETRLFYVSTGSLRIFFPHAGDEICVGFAYDNSLICSYPSFIQQLPSEYFIQALRRTSLVAVMRRDFYGSFEDHPVLERAWRMLEEDALLGKIQREVEMLTFTPEERYRRLLQRSPQVFQHVPRKYIASYLRMTPETMSRIKAE